MEKEKMKQTIKLCVALTAFSIIIIIVIAIMIKYQVEGEKNMPFNLSKIVIVSTAEGNDIKGKKLLNSEILQNNDVRIFIDRDEKYWKDGKIIKAVKLENINITKAPVKGEIKAFMPNSLEGRYFNYKDEYLIQDGKLEFKGAAESNPQTLEIGSKGGYVLFNFSNVGLGTYSSDKEIEHDGTMLKELKISNEEIQFDVNFDIIIILDNCSYRTNITLQMPCGDIIQDGMCYTEKTDFDNLIFRRE